VSTATVRRPSPSTTWEGVAARSAGLVRGRYRHGPGQLAGDVLLGIDGG
jgi:hypothetical protein